MPARPPNGYTIQRWAQGAWQPYLRYYRRHQRGQWVEAFRWWRYPTRCAGPGRFRAVADRTDPTTGLDLVLTELTVAAGRVAYWCPIPARCRGEITHSD